MTSLTVWCLLIDQEKTPIGSLFKVPLEEDIADLKDGVKLKKPSELQNVDADSLVVWRCKERSAVLDKENLKDQIRKLFSDPGAEEIDERTAVTDLELLGSETLLVQVPSVFLPSFNRILLSVVQNQCRGSD
jgi:hypothetical protein